MIERQKLSFEQEIADLRAKQNSFEESASWQEKECKMQSQIEKNQREQKEEFKNM